MKKYAVKVVSSQIFPDEIEAEDEIEAQEEMFNRIMDNVDLYLNFVIEEIENESEENEYED